MLRRKIYAFIIFIVFLFTIKSCIRYDKDQNKATETIENEIVSFSKPLYDRELELIEVLNHYDVPTGNTTIVLMPPTKCSSCKLGALKVLDTMQNIYILTGDSSFCTPQNKSQKLIFYDPQLINKKGLVKLYSAIITIKQNKVIHYEALTN
ncbi:MAG: hypothetical protein ACK4RM_01335 [Flavobacterium sp.]